MEHGAALRTNFLDAGQVEDVVENCPNSDLEASEVALIDFVEKVTLRAHEISQEDIDTLRAHRFSDTDVLDIALAAAARSFYSKMVDSLGVAPSPEWLKRSESVLGQDLLQKLTVGRPLPMAD